MSLTLDVRLDGFAHPIGKLARDDKQAVQFTYTKEHLQHPNAFAVSLALPLTDEPFGDVATRAYFDNLLQERDDVLARVMTREALARDDIVGLLFHLGRDCAGALSVLAEHAPAVKVPGDLELDYLPISPEHMTAIVRSLHERRRLPDHANDPSPLAGVQSKVALVYLPDGRFLEPRPGSGAPTTHILKVPDRDHLRDAFLEAEAMTLSSKLGFATAAVDVQRIADIDVLIVDRFDRALDGSGKIVRIHQEDFAQALGLPPTLKYERAGAGERRFDAHRIATLLNLTVSPFEARDRFIGATLFDLMTGNVDAHAKNHALLYRMTGTVDLAPRYDLLPTRLDPNLTDQLAFNIGAATHVDQVTAAQFDAFLSILGIVGAPAQRRIRSRIAKVVAAGLAENLDELGRRNGMKLFADLIASNMRTLLPELGVDVPASAQARDAFINRGGGWV